VAAPGGDQGVGDLFVSILILLFVFVLWSILKVGEGASNSIHELGCACPFYSVPLSPKKVLVRFSVDQIVGTLSYFSPVPVTTAISNSVDGPRTYLTLVSGEVVMTVTRFLLPRVSC